MAKPTEATETPKPLDIFEYARTKSTLMNRVLRALKDAPTEEMRQQIIAEVAAFNNFKPQGGQQ